MTVEVVKGEGELLFFFSLERHIAGHLRCKSFPLLLLFTSLLLRFLRPLLVFGHRRSGSFLRAAHAALLFVKRAFLLFEAFTWFAAFVIAQRQGQLRAGESLGLRLLPLQVVIQLAHRIEMSIYNDAIAVLALDFAHGAVAADRHGRTGCVTFSVRKSWPGEKRRRHEMSRTATSPRSRARSSACSREAA